MKKYLIFLVLIFNFIFIDNVFAADYTSITFNQSFFDTYIHDINDNLQSNVISTVTRVKNGLNINPTTEDYYIYYDPGNNYVLGYKWAKSLSFTYYPGLSLSSTNTTTSSTRYLYMFVYGRASSSSVYYYQAYTNNANVYSGTTSEVGSTNYRIVNGGTSVNGIYQNNGDKKHLYYESSVNLIFNNYLGFTYKFEPIIVGNTDTGTDYIYSYGDDILSSNGTIIVPFVPDINNYHSFSDVSLGVNSSNLTISSVNNFVSPVATNSIYCNADRDFDALGYCNFNYSDLPDLPYSSSSHTTMVADFTFSFGSSTSPTYTINPNKYYIFTYRFSKNYNPFLSTFILKFNNDNNDYQIPITNLFVRDSGSYIDYQLLFNTSSISTPSQLSLIRTFYNTPLGDTYSENTISTFGFGVSRFYKITEFDTMPTTEDINNDYRTNNLNDVRNINNGSLNYFNNFKVDDHELSYFVTAPLRLIDAIDDNNACTPLTFRFPHSNQDITVNCLQSTISNTFGIAFNILQVILSGFVLYRIGIAYFVLFKHLINPNDDKIEVIDL